MNGVWSLDALIDDGGRNDLYHVSRFEELISGEKFGGGRTRTIYVRRIEISEFAWVGVVYTRRPTRTSIANGSLRLRSMVGQKLETIDVINVSIDRCYWPIYRKFKASICVPLNDFNYFSIYEFVLNNNGCRYFLLIMMVMDIVGTYFYSIASNKIWAFVTRDIYLSNIWILLMYYNVLY